MKRLATLTFALLAAAAFAATPAAAQIQLNEIRTDHSGTDVDEYVEVAGPAGAALTGLHVVVIGDGTGGCGVVEQAVALGAFSIQGDGVFAIRVSTGAPSLTGYDATVSGSFENTDNLTFLLVSGWTGAVGNDLDTNNDGTLDVTPWTAIVDHVGLNKALPIDCTTEEYLYTTNQVGPDGVFVPVHIYRCANGWNIGPFGTAPWPTGNVDTPGSPNNCATPARQGTWGAVKAIYR